MSPVCHYSTNFLCTTDTRERGVCASPACACVYPITSSPRSTHLASLRLCGTMWRNLLTEEHVAITTPLRIGVVGAGAIATLGHIPGFQRLPDVQVAAICDKNVERAQNIATQFNIPNVYEDYQDLLAQDNLDAITVAVPNVLHAEVTLAALEAGKHVL